MHSLRLATMDDFNDIVRMISDFCRTLPYHDITQEKIYDGVTTFLTSPKTERIIILAEDGQPFACLAASIQETPFSRDKYAVEWAWWSDYPSPASIKMFNGFDTWARMNRCRYAQVSALHGGNHEVLDRIYTKRGYNLREQIYLKEYW